MCGGGLCRVRGDPLTLLHTREAMIGGVFSELDGLFSNRCGWEGVLDHRWSRVATFLIDSSQRLPTYLLYCAALHRMIPMIVHAKLENLRPLDGLDSVSTGPD